MVKGKKQQREEHGELTTEDGQLIIDEEEFRALSDIKEVSGPMIHHDKYKYMYYCALHS